MNSLWNDEAANEYKDELGLRVYTSRLLGQDKNLVLHGGGNTSVKIKEIDIFGNEEEILYVKGSGWDLSNIEEGGFSPVRLKHLKKLADLDKLTDPEMVNELVTHMTKATAPVPSVEAILHAILPYKYVDHTHADAVVTITNSVGGFDRIEEIYGDSTVVIPYVMPGFDLAQLCAKEFVKKSGPQTIGMVLLNHGIFSFGDTAKESYERMIELVGRAESYLSDKCAWDIECAESVPSTNNSTLGIAALRNRIADIAGFPTIVARYTDRQTLSFVHREDIAVISQEGPATPDHVIRTKRLPMIGRDVKAYAKSYRSYFNKYEPQARERKTMLDPAPRVVLDGEFGLCAVGRSAKEASIAGEIYSHTIEIILRSTALGGYRALTARDIFDVEYWDLEQAKIRKSGTPPLFSGEIAFVTGAASGIGRACVEAFLMRGAAVVAVDVNPEVVSAFSRGDYLGIACDITDEDAIESVLKRAVDTYGGIDMLVLNAGIFPSGCRIDALDSKEWRRVMQVNLDANLVFLRETYPLLKLAPRGGRAVIVGSKNVPAPGPGAAAYSASKAALNQLARVAALEWGDDNIRINSLHPNAVFDTALWTDVIVESRAKHYGLTVEEYKKSNILRTEVTSRDVAELSVEMCGPLFAKTTGAQIPVDGGNERVI